MSERTRLNGWGRPLNASKWHYFDGEIVSLCRKWMFAGETEQGMDGSTENCAECRRKKLALDKKRAAESEVQS